MESTQGRVLYEENVSKTEKDVQVIVDGAELSDDQLEAVAGGKSGISGGGCILVNFPGDPTPTFPDTDPILY